jgi:Mg-chelatase subunit ChlD
VNRQVVIGVLAVLMFAGSLSAQGDACVRRRVAVNALDGQNRFAPDIAADDLRASLSRQPLRILSVTASHTVRLVIVADASSSMFHDESVWNSSIDVQKRLLESVPTETQVGLVVFSTDVERTISLTTDHDRIAEELDALRASRASRKGIFKTALWDALAHSMSLFR